MNDFKGTKEELEGNLKKKVWKAPSFSVLGISLTKSGGSDIPSDGPSTSAPKTS